MLRNKRVSHYIDWVDQDCNDIILEVVYYYEHGTDGDYYTQGTAPEVKIEDVIDMNGNTILDLMTQSELEEIEDQLIEVESQY